MKAGRCAKWAAMAAALLLLAFDASAQGQQRPPPDPGDGAGMQRMNQGQQRPPHRGDGGGPPPGMGPAAHSAQFGAADAAAPRGGQMSKEERRQLRRDVHDAGREIYPERRRAGHRGPPQ